MAQLRGYLTRGLTDIEAKAPLIAQQRRDYERALLEHEELAARLGEALRAGGAAAVELEASRGNRIAAEHTELARQAERLLLAQI